MRISAKPVISVVLLIGAFVAGLLFLIRGCLSKYDERSALSHVLYFEQGDQHVVFSIVKFEKAVSYSQNGGFINKTVNTDYYVQVNDAVSGQKLKQEKVKNHSDIKDYPVEMLGADGNTAWLYMSEPIAFDPFTLVKIADKNILEEKNPSLKGKFPSERRYYRFDAGEHALYFTASDGSSWRMDTKTLKAIPSESGATEPTGDEMVKRIEELMKQNKVLQDCLYQQKSYRPS
ncbi:MAG TPA: PA2928 family protein [Chitinophagaceae bacterium]|nr:PA2928 family protein [Chitinophagaceae bacterium]